MAAREPKAGGTARRSSGLWRSASQPGLVPGAAGVACLALAALLTPGLFGLGPGGLAGIPQVAEIADRSYKAPSDIRIVDEAATADHRRQAAAQAVLVYDFDERRRSEVGERVAAAFTAARQALGGEATDEAGKPTPAIAFREALGEEAEVSDAVIEGLVKAQFAPEAQGLLLQLVSPIVALTLGRAPGLWRSLMHQIGLNAPD